MATISQHQTAPFAGPVSGTVRSAASVKANDDALRAATNAHDGDATIHVQSSTTASRPAFGTPGRVWYTSDDGQWWYDTGTAWVAMALSANGGTVAGGIAPATDGLVDLGTNAGRWRDAYLSRYVRTPQALLSDAAGAQRGLFLQSVGVNRWFVGTDTGPEAGANAGANLLVQAYDDGGASLGTLLQFVRAAMQVQVTGTVAVRAAAGTSLVSVLATGDTVNRISMNNAATPTIAFGSGSAPTDCSISRDAAGRIRVGPSLIVGANDPGAGTATGTTIAIANVTTAPTTNPAGGGILYAEGGALKWRGPSGAVTTLAPA